MTRKLLIAFGALVLFVVIAGLGAHYYWTHRYDGRIVAVSRKYKLDPSLVKAVVYEESFFDAKARSTQNALGLMQVTPIAAQEWLDSTRAGNLKAALAAISSPTNKQHEPKLEDALHDPTINLHVGCWYLQNLLNRYHDNPDSLAVALAAYNAGPANVEKWASEDELKHLSKEEFLTRIEFPVTRNYVQKIIERYEGYKLNGGLP
jgi:soluble lytic murein transglycosylase